MYYLCYQKVEEDVGSAEEQPTSIRLSAIYSKGKGDGFKLSLLFTGLAQWLRKPILFNQIKNGDPTKQPSISRLSYKSLFSNVSKKVPQPYKADELQGFVCGHFRY